MYQIPLSSSQKIRVRKNMLEVMESSTNLDEQEYFMYFVKKAICRNKWLLYYLFWEP